MDKLIEIAKIADQKPQELWEALHNLNAIREICSVTPVSGNGPEPDHKELNELHLLHRLWTKAVGTQDYVKDEWRRMEAIVLRAQPKEEVGAASHNGQGWVRVEDGGLPKVTGVYSVYPPEKIDSDQGLTCSSRYFMANENRNTFTGNKLAYGWVTGKLHKITHWQPLPAPPSEANGPTAEVSKPEPRGFCIGSRCPGCAQCS